MTKPAYNIVLYSLIGLLLLAGGLLFLFHGRLFDYLGSQMDLAPLTTGTVTVVPPGEALDTSALQSPRFLALADYVVNFDFDNICWRPDTKANRSLILNPAVIATSTATATAATGATLNCQTGNDLPFQAKVK
ncbi:MAG: hypothetical protein WC453_00835 [Patescibacteria group bacterium]